MKCGARVALGVAGGYFLGRTKKMKLALMLGGMAAGRQAGGPGELLAQGAKLLQGNAQIAALTDQVRSQLLDAGKNAVLSVATRQVESLTDRVGKRVEALATPAAARGRPRDRPSGRPAMSCAARATTNPPPTRPPRRSPPPTNPPTTRRTNRPTTP